MNTMTQTFADDIAGFYADFGVTGKFSDGSETTGIYDRAYLELNLGESGQESMRSEFHFPTQDLPKEYDEGDTIEIEGITYEIKNLRQDNTGVTIAELEITPGGFE